MTKKLKPDKIPPSPLDSNVGVYNRGRNGGYFLIGYSPLREVLTNIESKYVDLIREYRKTKDKEIKARLLSYTPCGYYGDNPRAIKSKLEYKTGQVQLDFDGDKSKLKQIFDECKFVTAAGISAGGKGMFLLINTPGDNYSGYFYALVNHFKTTYGKQVDLAVSSINELRFVSLPSEVMTREDPTLWTLAIDPPEQLFNSFSVVGTSNVIEVPKEKIGKLHYHDLSSYAGISNANGVPAEKAADYIASIPFDKSSHLYGKPEAIRAIVMKHYNVYAEQHGEAGARLVLARKNSIQNTVELPILKFSKKETRETHSLQVINAVLGSYSIVVDRLRLAYKYNGNYWEQISDTQLDQFLVQCAEACGYPASKAGTLSFRKNLFELAQKEAGIDELTTDRTAFNLSNGVLVFNPDNTISFSEHDESKYFTYMLDYKYDPKAKCPKFDAFLNKVMPNPENQNTFFQYVASVFDPGRIEKMLFLVLINIGLLGIIQSIRH